jgi:rod shape-determining protein MreB and related proteins
LTLFCDLLKKVRVSAYSGFFHLQFQPFPSVFLMFANIFGFGVKDIGIDLGTANTLVYVKDHGIVLREPSVVAVKTGTNEVVAVGDDAKRMLGRTPGGITAIRPLKDGVIADFRVTEAMLRHFIRKVHNNRRSMRGPRVVIAVPSGITEVEKRAVKESAEAAGAREVYLIEEPMAAAIGVGLPVQEAAGNMIVDIGGGTTEVAIISLSGIVYSRSVRVAGDELDDSIINYMKRAYNLMIGERTAEEIKLRIGSAFPLGKETTMEVKGRDMVAGLPKTITITSQEVREAMLEPLNAIIDAVRTTLERCPPELAADLVDRGIMLAGGGALLRGLDKLLQEETALPVHVAEDPLSAVGEGAGRVLNELEFLKKVSTTEV